MSTITMFNIQDLPVSISRNIIKNIIYNISTKKEFINIVDFLGSCKYIFSLIDDNIYKELLEASRIMCCDDEIYDSSLSDKEKLSIILLKKCLKCFKKRASFYPGIDCYTCSPCTKEITISTIELRKYKLSDEVLKKIPFFPTGRINSIYKITDVEKEIDMSLTKRLEVVNNEKINLAKKVKHDNIKYFKNIIATKEYTFEFFKDIVKFDKMDIFNHSNYSRIDLINTADIAYERVLNFKARIEDTKEYTYEFALKKVKLEYIANGYDIDSLFLRIDREYKLFQFESHIKLIKKKLYIRDIRKTSEYYEGYRLIYEGEYDEETQETYFDVDINSIISCFNIDNVLTEIFQIKYFQHFVNIPKNSVYFYDKKILELVSVERPYYTEWDNLPEDVCIPRVRMFRNMLPNNLKKFDWNSIIETNIYQNWISLRFTNDELENRYLEKEPIYILYKELFEIYLWREKRMIYIEKLNEDKEGFYEFFKKQNIFNPALYYNTFMTKYKCYISSKIGLKFLEYKKSSDYTSFKVIRYDNEKDNIDIIRYSNYDDTTKYLYFRLSDFERIIKHSA